MTRVFVSRETNTAFLDVSDAYTSGVDVGSIEEHEIEFCNGTPSFLFHVSDDNEADEATGLFTKPEDACNFVQEHGNRRCVITVLSVV